MTTWLETYRSSYSSTQASDGDAFGSFIAVAGITERFQKQRDVAGVADGGLADSRLVVEERVDGRLRARH